MITHYLFEDHIEFIEELVQEKINSFALSSKIYLLADNDNANGKSKKGNRERVLSKLSRDKANFLYQNTNVKEIENLLPVKIIKDFMSEIVGENVIQKAQTIQFTMKDYENKGLGEIYLNIKKEIILKIK